MKLSNVKVGTVLTLTGSSAKYVVAEIEGEDIRLENIRVMAEMNIYLQDLSMMFQELNEEE